MNALELLRRIDARLKATGLTERKAGIESQNGPDFIRDIRRRHHSPKADKLVRLAKVLGVPPMHFIETTQEGLDQPKLQPAFALGEVSVKGEVQAGIWREALEWNPAEWFSIMVPMDDRFAGVERFGLVVRGPSMNEVYPDGTIAIVVRFDDIGRLPVSGERVVALRYSDEGTFEATIKEYKKDATGRHILWPRSSDPDFQSPIVLGHDRLVLSASRTDLPQAVSAGHIPMDDSGVIISALVVGSYRPEVPIR